jgi:hypothetical protein
MIEQEPLVPHWWNIETDVVVAPLGTTGFFRPQRLTACRPPPLMNQTKEERSNEEYMAR